MSLLRTLGYLCLMVWAALRLVWLFVQIVVVIPIFVVLFLIMVVTLIILAMVSWLGVSRARVWMDDVGEAGPSVLDAIWRRR